MEALAFGPKEDFQLLLKQAKNQLIETEQMIKDQEDRKNQFEQRKQEYFQRVSLREKDTIAVKD